MRTRFQWPRTPRRVAAVLRQELVLPGLTVVVRGEMVHVRWLEGPPHRDVDDELERALPHWVAVRWARLYRPATFGAALLSLVVERDMDRCRYAWRLVQDCDLDAQPFPADLIEQGGALAAAAGVPSNGRLGWHRQRWDLAMHVALRTLGVSTLEAICRRPG